MTKRVLSILLLSALLARIPLATAQTSPASSMPMATNRELQRLDSTVAAAERRTPFDAAASEAARMIARTRLWWLIAADSVRTPSDFLVASNLAGDSFFESRRVQYELALAGFVSDRATAISYVTRAWDGLTFSLGQGQRIGTFLRDGVLIGMDHPAPSLVRSAFKDLAALSSATQGAADNVEVQRLRDADQLDRRPPFTLDKLKLMQANDAVRHERIAKIIEDRGLVTARDFTNAALLMQHGTGFVDYALAHELSIVAVALGDRSAVGLITDSYDRMLLHLGHRQRFGTQIWNSGIAPLDTTALNDRIRSALGRLPLSKLRKP